MSRLLGEARVSILPDDKRFKPEAEAQLKKASAHLQATAKLTLEDKNFQEKRKVVQAELKQLQDKITRARLDADNKDFMLKYKQVKAALDVIDHKVSRAKIDADISRAEVDLHKVTMAMDKFSYKKVKAKAGVDTGDSGAKLRWLNLMLDKTGLRRVTAHVNVDTEKGRRALSGFIGFIGGWFDKHVAQAADNSGHKFGSGFMAGLGKSALMQNPGITAAVVAGMAALPAALGVVGAVGGVALGAGLIAAAEKLVSSQIKNLTSSIKQGLTGSGKVAKDQLAVQNAQTALANAGISTKTTNPFAGQQQQIAIQNKQLAIQNTQATIARLEGQKKLAASQQQQLVSAKARLVIEKQALALAQAQAAAPATGGNPAAQNKAKAAAQGRLAIAQQQLKTDQATSKLNNSNQDYTLKQQQQQLKQYQAYQQSFFKLNDAIKNAKMSFAQFAITATKPLLGPFTDAVNYLSGQLRGPLAKSFHDLFAASAPYVKPLVMMFTDFVKTLLPGWTTMLRAAKAPLSSLLINIGKIVGTSFGNWFKAAIPYIKDSAKYFLVLLKALGFIGVILVKFGGEVAKAFGGKELTGFAPLLKEIANDIVKLIGPALAGWLSVMAPVTKALLQMMVPLLNFLANHPALVKAITAVVAAFMLFSRIKLAMNAAAAGIGGLKKALDGLSKGNWIALIIAAVVAVTILIITHWKQIRTFLMETWHYIYDHFGKFLAAFFENTIPHSLKVLRSVWEDVWSHIGKYVKPVWDFIYKFVSTEIKLTFIIIKTYLNIIRDIWDTVWRILWGTIKFIWRVIVDVIKVYWAIIRDVFKVFLAIITGNWKAAWNAIKDFVHVLWSSIKDIFKAALDWIWGLLKDIWGLIKNLTRDIWNGIKGFLSTLWNAIKGIAKTVWNGILGFFRGVWTTLKNDAKNDWNIFKGIILGVWNGIKSASKTIWGGIVSGIKDAWNGIKKVVATPINAVIGFVDKYLIGGVDLILSTIGIKGSGPHGGPIPNIPKIPGYAHGGKVTAGTHSTADDVLVRVSKNETILSANHSKHLAPLLGQIGVPGYAKGGLPSNNKNGNTGATHKGWIGTLPGFAKGGRTATGASVEQAMLAFMESKVGHPYSQTLGRFGPKYFDCSGLVYDAANAAGLPLPRSQALANLEIDWFSRLPGAYTYGAASQMQPGDIIGMRGADPINGIGHIGMVDQGRGPNARMVSAYDTALGVTHTPINGFVRGVSLAGAGGNNIFKDLGHLALTALKSLGNFAVNSIFDLLQVVGIPTGVLDSIRGIIGLKTPGGDNKHGWAGKMPFQMLGYMDKKALGWVKNAAFTALKRVFAPQIAAMNSGPGGGPAGSGTSAGEMANGIQLYQYLLHNLFAGNKIAAAGATASIWGESTWNPFAQGSGGRGLIGWTPPGTISNAAFSGGMRTQLPAILQFVGRNGDEGVIRQMMRASSVSQAAWEWGRGVERFGIPDVHPQGLNLATQIMKSHANGGVIHEPVVGFGLKTGLGYSFGEGGRHERVLTDSQSQQYDNNKRSLDALHAQNNLLAEQIKYLRIIAASGQNTAKNLGGMGRGVL